ncbi:MAG: endolytic transglycosylase MltG [Armatimonadetes bacterium]|nr:endolytic transglycosylase MltG [Armatimonadota bacterium]
MAGRRKRRTPRRRRWGLRLFIFLLVVLGGAGGLAAFLLSPLPTGPDITFRIQHETPAKEVVADLAAKGVVRNVEATMLVATIKDLASVETGTYRLHPGMDVRQVIAALRKPLKQDVMVPAGWWAARVGKRLEEKGVCSAKEYTEATKHPEKFQDVVTFPLPQDSLEGYLFPDTYDLPPLLGADEVVRRQLRAFEEKVVKPLGKKGLGRALVIASMVELEAAKDSERPVIAGVIENRIAKGQKLEMDATVLYALQEWKVLGPGVVHTVKSPYNTYEHAGLPPGPIGSPGKASIEAALKPAKHGYFFYVAKPDRSHTFSATYDEHLKAIKAARTLWAEAKKKP